ncbi:MAG: hypothetical protein ACD_3C00116G0006 [uncultured bacterium (gcode 4)]|uniref:Uncharacterized protein n=1 Tax=uncultured bacterium (gcode 4) TaxID=1234023 RepID=K2GCJ7_9BACT|nr:MAG: hypothetical protein ACD_3C00116G0006 [uncultured bacterium (gcode 4)]
MRKLDFSRFSKKYVSLTEADINFLNDYFNREETVKKLEIFEKARRRFAWTIMALWFIGDLYFLYDFNSYYPLETFESIMLFNALTLFFWMFILITPWIWIKGKIIPDMIKELKSDLEYDSEGKYDFDKSIFLEKWLLNKYNDGDLIEDSMHYAYIPESSKFWKSNEEIALINKKEVGWFEVYSCEFRSYIRSNSRKWGSHPNNHATLTKIILNNSWINLRSDIVLKTNIKNDKKMLLAWSLLLSLILTQLIGFILSLSWWFDILKPYLGSFFNGQSFHYYANWIIFIATTAIIFVISNIVSIKRKVKTENVEFEKEFIIECDDQIEARKILTPSFMYKIYDFVNSIDKWRKYEFIFKKNEIYIKRDLKWFTSFISFWWIFPVFWWYMEISFFKNLFNNIEQLLQFYIELKGAENLANELGLLYFDKTTLDNEIIQN